MLTTKDLCDNKTSYSTTRWGFVSVIKFDMVIIVCSILMYLICMLIGKPLDESFFYAVGTLLGILTALVTAGKTLQGFEPKSKSEKNIDDCENNGK